MPAGTLQRAEDLALQVGVVLAELLAVLVGAGSQCGRQPKGPRTLMPAFSQQKKLTGTLVAGSTSASDQWH